MASIGDKYRIELAENNLGIPRDRHLCLKHAYMFHGSECVAFTEVFVKRTHFKSVELREKLATTQPIASAQSVMASHCTDFGTGVQV